jgi:hypothetical protein
VINDLLGAGYGVRLGVLQGFEAAPGTGGVDGQVHPLTLQIEMAGAVLAHGDTKTPVEFGVIGTEQGLGIGVDHFHCFTY